MPGVEFEIPPGVPPVSASSMSPPEPAKLKKMEGERYSFIVVHSVVGRPLTSGAASVNVDSPRFCSWHSHVSRRDTAKQVIVPALNICALNPSIPRTLHTTESGAPGIVLATSAGTERMIKMWLK
ncbi:unnamed protein product, partial [Ectocarpus sp. 8 AP-2014]